jgi:hypothetical protein
LSGSTSHSVTKLSVVIPATNAPDTLVRCVTAISNAEDVPDELIVIEEPQNAGPAWARNRGAQRARHDVIVFVDADVEVAPDALRRIREAFDALPGLTAIFGSYDDSPEDSGVVSSFRNLLHHHVHQQGGGSVATFWAGLGAIRREPFLEANGFDERRFPQPSVEDIELGMRLAAGGKEIRLDPTIQGRHLKRWTFGSMVRTDLFRRGVPWMELLLASGQGRTALNLGWRHRVSALASVALVAALMTRRPRQAGLPILLLLVLNRSFYALVLRKRGAPTAAAAVPLHIIHHLTSAAAVPLALASHLLGRRRKDAV